MPVLDAVLISHMHFDHLSLGSIEDIERKIRWMGVPRGGLVYLTNFRFAAEEVHWWDSRMLPGGLKMTSVPVKHNGMRYVLDRSWRTGVGYTAWVAEYNGLTVYYGGDSAWDERVYRSTAERFPEIDLALLPIAPIHPREFMRTMHLDPEEALDAFELLGAKWMMPIHFETFINSTDEPDEPRRVLREAIKRRGIGVGRVIELGIGEQKVVMGR